MKFLHTADLHLDRSFEGLTTIPEQLETLLSSANQQTLKHIVDTAISHDVDFVLLAGDTFHQSRPTLKTQRYFFQEMDRLKEAEIPVFMNFGNHDFYQEDRYWFTFPENITRFETEEVTTVYFKTKHNEEIALSSFSYQHARIEEQKLSEFPLRGAVDYHLGMYHGGQSPYAPFQLSELVKKGYDYWALGHIHVPQVLSETPMVLYPGTPQGHTQKEENLAGVVIVESSGKTLRRQQIPVETIRWETQRLSLKGIKHPRDIFRLVRSFTYSSQTLLHLILSDTGDLTEELNYQIASGELREALQEEMPNNGWIFRLSLEAEAGERPYLAIEEQLMDQLISGYQEPQVFTDLVKELEQSPILHSMLSAEFKEEVLHRLKEQMTRTYRFRRDEDVD